MGDRTGSPVGDYVFLLLLFLLLLLLLLALVCCGVHG